jgi:hypothetical protein
MRLIKLILTKKDLASENIRLRMQLGKTYDRLADLAHRYEELKRIYNGKRR